MTNPFGQSFWLEYDRDGKNALVLHPNGVQEVSSYNTRDWLSELDLYTAANPLLAAPSVPSPGDRPTPSAPPPLWLKQRPVI